MKRTFILVDILSYSRQTFYTDSNISYNSFQHTRSRSKKLKTPEDESVSAMVVGAEIIPTEVATDGFKVNEKPAEKVRPENTEVPSGEEENISRMQLDQHLLDNIEVSGEIRTDYISLVSCRLLILGCLKSMDDKNKHCIAPSGITKHAYSASYAGKSCKLQHCIR